MTTMTIQVRGRGTLTLPASLREKYRLGEGDPLTRLCRGRDRTAPLRFTAIWAKRSARIEFVSWQSIGIPQQQ